MHIVLDLILVALVAFVVWRGWRNGIIIGVCGLVAIIISLVVANVVSTAYSGEFSDMLEPFVTGVVDGAVSDVTSGAEAKKNEIIIELSDEEKRDVGAVTFASMRRLGLSESASQLIADKVKVNASAVGHPMVNEVTGVLCDILAYITVAAILFILLIIVFTVIGNIINLSFKLPGLELVNDIGGAALGLLRGITLIFILGILFRYGGILLPAKDIEKTVLLSWIMNNNFIASLMGI